MDQMTAQVRRATAADLDAVAEALSAAFDGDPWIAWVVAADRHRERIRQLQHNLLEAVGLPHGEVWLAEDDYGNVVGSAVWLLAGRDVPQTAWAELAAHEAELMGDRHASALAAAAATRHLRPDRPHHLLATLGVLPSWRRRGTGSALLAPMLARADVAGVESYLETSVEASLRFYRGLGFEVSGHVLVPDGGPPVWSLVRPPRADA